MSPSWRAFWDGARAQLPILLGVVPFGLIYGVLAVGAGLSPLAAQAMSAMVFAGSSQYIAAGLFAAAAPWPIILLTTLVVNMRHALYAASVAPYLVGLPGHWKGLLAYLLTDEAYAVAIQRYRAPAPAPDRRHVFFAGTGLALWLCWQLSTAAGVFIGASVPPEWNLDFALPLTFIAIMVPLLTDRPSLLAAVVAGLVATAAAGLPFQLGLLVAALAGILGGTVASTRRAAPQQSEVV